MREHKAIDIVVSPGLSSNETVKLFNDLAKDGWCFLIWISKWREFRDNGWSKHRRTALFYKDVPDA